MRLITRRGGQASRLVLGAVLCVSAFSSCAVAQTLQPKKAPPARAKPAPAQPVPAQPVPGQPTWVVACANTKAGLACRAAQSRLFKQANRNVRVSVAVQIPPGTKKPKLVLLLPLGVYLPSGLTLRFGDGKAKALPFRSCDPNGCLAEYPISEAEVTSIEKGADLTLSVQALNKTRFMFTMPATGFSAAYTKMKSN